MPFSFVNAKKISKHYIFLIFFSIFAVFYEY